MFEKLIFNSLFKHTDDDNLLNSNQSQLLSADFCVHQPLAITNDICKAFDINLSLDVIGFFLVLFNMFDRAKGLVTHNDILKICGIIQYFKNTF